MVIKLDEIEKAINQLLIAHGTVEDGVLVSLVASLKDEFRSDKIRPLKESFARINQRLRPFSMEIKSIVRSRCTGCETITNQRPAVCESCEATVKSEWVYHHGIVNVEEDAVSKAEGTELKPDEIKFFSELTQKLLEDTYLSTDDVYRIKVDKWNPSNTDSLLEKLRMKGWLQRDDRSFWEIGVRTHLELRNLIEDAIKNVEKGDNDAETDENVREKIGKLPQIMTY